MLEQADAQPMAPAKRRRRFRFARMAKPKKQPQKPKPNASQHQKKKKQSKKPSEVPTVDAHMLPANFRRSQAGRQAIRAAMEILYTADLQQFGSKPMFAEGDGLCRLKNVAAAVDVTWKEVKARSPTFFECTYHNARSAIVYGQAVHSELQRILKDLRSSKRDSFILLLKSILENTKGSLK